MLVKILLLQFSSYIRIFIKVLIETNVNTCICNKLLILMMYFKWKLHWVTSKVYLYSFNVHSPCTQPSVVYSSINLRKIKFILINSFCLFLHEKVYGDASSEPSQGVQMKANIFLCSFNRNYTQLQSSFLEKVGGGGGG